MKREGYTITDHADWYWFGHKKWSSRQGNKITRIIPHHMAGNLTKAQFDSIMSSSRQMSPTVAVYSDGSVSAYVPEEMRPWTTSGWEADKCALTLEIANDEIGGNWHISDKAYNMAVAIMAEWCIRYNITPSYKANRKGTIQMHKEWANTACPGPYLSQKITSGQLTKDINAAIAKAKGGNKIYVVQCGAYSKKVYAVNLAQKLKNAGFTAILKNEDGKIKVQCGAFSVKANAEALANQIKAKKFNVAIIEKTQ